MSALGYDLVCQLYEEFTKYARDIDYIQQITINNN